MDLKDVISFRISESDIELAILILRQASQNNPNKIKIRLLIDKEQKSGPVSSEESVSLRKSSTDAFLKLANSFIDRLTLAEIKTLQSTVSKGYLKETREKKHRD